MKCPTCGKGTLVKKKRDLSYSYRAKKLCIKQVVGSFCSLCEEAVLDASESKRVSEAMHMFHQKVDRQLMDPHFITKVRKKLDLGQREAAKIFGGGINTFSRYENGKAKPPLALVKLLYLLDKHPSLLPEIS